MNNPLLPPRRVTSLDDRLIPLINIVFLLLIFFLIAGQITQQQNAAIQAPLSSAEPSLRNPEWLLEMDAEKQLRLNGDPVRVDELAQRLTQQVPVALASKGSARPLSIKLDRSLRAGDMDEVLHIVRNSGASRVTLLTSPLTSERQ